MSTIAVTLREREFNTITKHKLIVYGATHNMTCAEVKLLFDIYKISYNYSSMRTTFYNAGGGKKLPTNKKTKKNLYTRSTIPPHLLDEVEAMFAYMLFVKLCLDSIPKEYKRTSYIIQGDYQSSINNLHNLVTTK